jgi:hypothetical protein
MTGLERRLERRGELLVLALVVVLGASATVVATSRYGIGLTPDSIVYLDGARSLADGDGYTREGTPITIFAPGYSAVLSLGDRLGLDVEDGARVLAALASAATTLLGFVLLRRHVRSAAVRAAGIVVIGCSGVLLGVFKEALSEHLFIVVVLLLLIVSEELVDRPRSVALLGAAVLLGWAGFYLRYAGIVLVPFVALVVLLAGWRLGWLAAVVRAAVIAMLALAAPLLWMNRNVDAGSDPLGGRHDASATPLTNVVRTVRTFGGWVAFDGPGVPRLVVLLGIAGVAVLVLTRTRVHGALLRRAVDLWPLALFVAVYVVYLVGTASLVAFGPIQTRFLIGVYVPLVVVGAWLVEKATRRLDAKGRTALVAISLAWVACNVVWFGARAVEAARNGAGGYASPHWHESELMDDVAALGADEPLVTNDSKAIALFTGREVIESVARTYVGSSDPTGDLRAFVAAVECEGSVGLVWFDGPGTRGRLFSPRALARHLRVEPRIERGDGVIYDLAPLDASADPGRPCTGLPGRSDPEADVEG